MLYMNAVYDWPFDAAHAGGNSIDVLDINGKPHIEQCDPGIYPSYFLDFGRQAGRDAFVNIFQKYIVDGSADGVYLDNFNDIPLTCKNKADPNDCEAIRNKVGNNASKVTKAQVDAYIAGKKQSLRNTVKLVAAGSGGIYTHGAAPNPYGANGARLSLPKTPVAAIALIQTAMHKNGYKYLVGN
jgi:hypothetical protein